MQFDQISVSEEKVSLVWMKPVALNTTLAERLESADTPAPELTNAMAAFKPYVRGLVGLPDDFGERMEIRTVHLKEDEKTGLRTLQVVCILTCVGAGSKTTTFTTPLMRARGDTEGGFFLDQIEMDLIIAVETAAEAFVKGERSQRDLFPTNAEAGNAELTPEQKGPPRRPKKGDFVRDGYPVVNQEGVELTDERVRQYLLQVERDVPLDAIATWTTTEREKAAEWARLEAIRLTSGALHKKKEPLVVKKAANLSLVGSPSEG